MADNANVPGSPDWWLGRLITRLMDRQQRFDLLECYVTGNHPVPEGDQRYVKTLREMQRRARTNYYGLVTKTPPERMHLRGFRFGDSASEADETARKVWSANNMDYQAPIVHNTASAFGVSYVMVSPPEDASARWATGLPVITVEDPRTTIVEADPANMMRSRAGLRMWVDDIIGKVMVLLYLPDAVFQYVGPAAKDLTGLDRPQLTRKLLAAPQQGGLALVDSFENPLGAVPIVQMDWIPTTGEIGFAEAEDVMDIQDRINSQILERTIITKMQAYKQRWVTGVKPGKDKNGQSKAPFEPGADILWVTDNPDVKFGEFDQVDISQLLEAVRDDVGDMAAITKTPAHYLMNRMANVSGDTLTQAEAGLVSKTKQRMIAVGWGWERVMRLCFAYLNDPKATEVDVEVMWAHPQLYSRAELADAFGKEVASGLPLAIAAERLGLEPDQIAFVVEEAERLAAEQKAAEEQQVELQTMALEAKSQTSTSPQEGNSNE